MSFEKKYIGCYHDDPLLDKVEYTIAHMTEERVSLDGQKYDEPDDHLEWKGAATIADAIDNSGFWAPKIKFGSDFSDEERKQAATYINGLVHDARYVGRFSAHSMSEYKDRTFTEDDLKVYVDDDVPAPVEDNSVDADSEDKDYGDE